MSLTAIGSNTPTQATTAVGATTAVSTSATGGGDAAAGIGGGAAGAYIAQPNSGSLVKKMLAGTVIGAGLGFAASFIPGLSFIPHFKLILPAAGAALGALAGGALHLFSKHKANLAMQAQAQQVGPQSVTPPATVPGPSAAGPTLKVGSKGAGVRTLQSNLKKLGMFPTKVSGVYDKATANAIRRYEVMKGVMPTGLGSADVRTSIAQDASLVGQYA